MKCCHCNNKIENELDMVLMTPDGDFACNKDCATQYETARDKFFTETIHNDKLMDQWWNE